jgi:Tetracyclin repressor-like, C-terminal domain
MSLLRLKAHTSQPRLLALIQDKLADDIASGRIETTLPLDDLAYTTLRVTESFHYLRTITGEPPADPDRAARVLKAILRPAGSARSRPVRCAGRLSAVAPYRADRGTDSAGRDRAGQERREHRRR